MRLIINADDMGTSEESNNTIFMLHKKGIVSSSTIIASGRYFSHAVEISKDNPNLGIGVHLCLDGPFNIGNGYQTIFNRDTNQFYNLDEILKKLKRFSIDESEVYMEYCLQIEKVLDSGIQISHLDHHHHLHLYLPSLRSMIKAAKRFNIRYIRTQKMLFNKHNNLIKKIYKSFHQAYLKSRIKTIDGYFTPDLQKDLNFKEQYKILSKLLSMNNKIIEIMLHPESENDPETRFFSSSKISNLLAKHEIVSYYDLN
ncbi:MAG: ChbG/HpnK family deacetylase [Bacteroidales bacterium]|nr:ChbG/HpnK family deacetylase [Bacteroidales bacterium]